MLNREERKRGRSIGREEGRKLFAEKLDLLNYLLKLLLN